MLIFSCPPTKERYLAEIKNLLKFKTRPICIMGKPRANINQIYLYLNSSFVFRNHCYIDSSEIIVLQNKLYILNASIKLASIQISNSE
jgi:hypothetical protein